MIEEGELPVWHTESTTSYSKSHVNKNITPSHLMKLGEHAGFMASKERWMEMMHSSGQKGIDSVGLPFLIWRTLSDFYDKGLGYMNAVYFHLRKGVTLCKS